MSTAGCHALKGLLNAIVKGYSPMTNFTFSIEQVRSAPPEVRRWIEHEIRAALAALNRSEHDLSQVHAATLAACMPQEAAQLFEMIKGNFLLSQIFFELARDMPNSHGAAPLHPISVADILRHTRLGDGDRLVDCFTAINHAFQTIRNDPEATLFGFDQQGHVFIHQATHDSIRQLWEQLFAARAPMANGPALAGFTPPHLGPSEDIAQHTPGSASANF
jgi:hypothetical protein